MRLWMAVWFAALTVPLSWMAAKHQGVLRTPDVDGPPALAATGQWRTIHVLVPGCDCSQRRARMILAENLSGHEYWLAGGGRLNLPAHCPVRRMTANQLRAETGIAGGPTLLVVDPEGRLRYAGGYRPGDPAGAGTLRTLQSGAPVSKVPVRGCAASSRSFTQTGDMQE
jgi:hypothetical protein